MRNLIFAVLMMLSFSAFAEVSTYDQTLKGKQCKEGLNQQLNCDYKIEDDFHLGITAVGQPVAGVSFLKSDVNGKHYGAFGILHGCVIIKNGIKSRDKNPLDIAFVSPINGKVYKDWKSCKTGQ